MNNKYCNLSSYGTKISKAALLLVTAIDESQAHNIFDQISTIKSFSDVELSRIGRDLSFGEYDPMNGHFATLEDLRGLDGERYLKYISGGIENIDNIRNPGFVKNFDGMKNVNEALND